MSEKPRVFVVQKSMHWDRTAGELKPKFDLSPAEEFGELVYLLSPTASPFHPEKLLDELHEQLQDATGDDYLLLVGNPVLIGIITAIFASKTSGEVNLLQWSGRDQKYTSVKVHDLYNLTEQPQSIR